MQLYSVLVCVGERQWCLAPSSGRRGSGKVSGCSLSPSSDGTRLKPFVCVWVCYPAARRAG